MARKFAAVVFSLGCLQAGSVMALGLGELTIDSFLNEPLKASVSLLNTGGLHQDEIRIRLATREDFKKLGLDRAYFLTSIKFEVIADDRGGARIVMSSEEPVLEPYLDFIVEARWPSGRLLREYTVLVDPPVFSQATPVISASQRVEEVEGIPAPAKKKAGTAASSGTAVDIKKSDLAPGAMPQRDYSATTSPTPMPGSRYMINRDDTLWEIAVESKPEGASVHQTMLDIQRLNPNAFINGNINRVKAGYIVYLPNSGDISSADLAAALSEVRQQNEDWRTGRDAQVASSGPSLRISAEPVATDDAAQAPGDDEREPGGSAGTVAMEEMDKAALASDEADERVAAMEEQVETLQRIVSVKDDKIAALESALAAATDVSVAPEMATEQLTGTTDSVATEPELLSAEDEPEADITEPEADITEPEAMPEPAATPAVVDTPAPAAPAKPTVVAPAKHEAASGGGLMSYIYYILGALGLAILGFIFMRRRGEDSEDESVPSRAPAVDAFSNVELQDQDLAVEVADDVAVVPAEERAPVGERGYGEHKHDEYASDDAGGADALAEADIYVAYGRHSQAKDLLNNAIANEPGNPLFRLKLLEIHTELNERGAATAQFEQLQAIGDAESLSRAEVLLEGLGAVAQEQERAVADVGHTDGGPGLSRNPLELMAESDTSLEADFSGLEIEESGAVDLVEDELDLSADFATSELAENGENDELVIAAESNGFSTKLDLARAYLDMGDDDGARQILEEVAAEASEEVKAEANALLDRIG